MDKRYDLKNIRAFLVEGFTDDELRRFCFDTPLFRPVYEELAKDTGKTAIVDVLIEYADRHYHLDTLLPLLKKANSAAYQHNRPYWEGDTEPEQHQNATKIQKLPIPLENSIKLEPPYGTMPPNSPFYIERPADNTCWTYLNQGRATTVYVQAPRQMGKSSLMRRVTHRMGHVQGIFTVFIDFERFAEKQFDNEEDFLIELCLMIGDALHIPEAIDQYWTSRRRSNTVKCSNYVAQHLIATYSKPFILAMDEVERLLTKPLCNDFFGMLRTWHNDRSWDTNFAQMGLFLSSSTEPHLFIDNSNQSPFNVAEPIVLQDFSLAEVEKLSQQHQMPLNSSQLGKLFILLGGHPFLTRLALYLLATQRIDFDTLLTTATSDSGPFGDHLRRYWQHLQEMPEVKSSLSQICRGHTYAEDKFYYRLKGAGLIKKDETRGKVVIRNELYARYFKERL